MFPYPTTPTTSWLNVICELPAPSRIMGNTRSVCVSKSRGHKSKGSLPTIPILLPQVGASVFKFHHGLVEGDEVPPCCKVLPRSNVHQLVAQNKYLVNDEEGRDSPVPWHARQPSRTHILESCKLVHPSPCRPPDQCDPLQLCGRGLLS